MAERSRASRAIRSAILYPIQGGLIYLGFSLCRLIPLTWASAFGSFLFRTFGPLLKGDRTARRNLKRVYPDISDAELDRMMRAIWDNLGRGAGEWAQIDRIQAAGPNARIDVIGEENLIKAIHRDGPFIVFAGHFGNWEMASLVPAHFGAPMVNIYRRASIPIMNYLFKKVRGSFCREMIPKGQGNARRILEILKEGQPLGILVDQRLNEGIPVPFMGHEAMTPTAPVELAMRFDCPLIPAQIERLPGVRFRLTFHEPLEIQNTGDKKADVYATTLKMNEMLEDWVRQKPEHWFWVHRRWPD